MTAASSSVPTPEATIGPFYPGAFLRYLPSDLTRVDPLLALQPEGQRLVLTGRCLDSSGEPIRSLIIESFQTNAHGRYRHPLDVSSAPLDPHFDGFARIRTDDAGRYRLETIHPGAPQSTPSRAPHLRWNIFASGIDRLATQIYFEGDPGLDLDTLLTATPPERRRLLIARKAGPAYELNLCLRGPSETPFFDDTFERTDEERVLAVVQNDRESEGRTPAEPLIRVSKSAWGEFTAVAPLPSATFHEGDLTRIGPGRPQADGEPVVIAGRLLDEEQRPVRRTVLEVWNANANGRYSHVIDQRNSRAALDPNFYGYGRLHTDDTGGFRLRTIMPGAYIAREDIGWWRPPHVHFSILGTGVRLVTQMYFPGNPLNSQDFIFQSLPDGLRPRAVAEAVPGGAERCFQWDIVLRGRDQTPIEPV